jgi:hypothetical protein
MKISLVVCTRELGKGELEGVKKLLKHALIPNHKMATPFCDFKTLTGFGF